MKSLSNQTTTWIHINILQHFLPISEPCMAEKTILCTISSNGGGWKVTFFKHLDNNIFVEILSDWLISCLSLSLTHDEERWEKGMLTERGHKEHTYHCWTSFSVTAKQDRVQVTVRFCSETRWKCLKTLHASLGWFVLGNAGLVLVDQCNHWGLNWDFLTLKWGS